MALSGITWGYCKGVRGYFEWHRGHVRFRRADDFQKRDQKLQIIKDIEPYRNVGVDNGVIGGRRQHRDMLRAHNLVEVGNEKPRQHPRDIAAASRNRPDPKIVESLKRASGGKWL